MITIIKLFLQSLIPQLIPILIYFLTAEGKVVLAAAVEIVQQVGNAVPESTNDEKRKIEFEQIMERLLAASITVGSSTIHLAIDIAIKNLPKNLI